MVDKFKILDGFQFNIKDVNIHLGISDLLPNKKFVKFNNYLISIVTITITYRGRIHKIKIPYYRSSGTSSSVVGSGTWFPFHGVTLEKGLSERDENYSYISHPLYSKNYFYKLGQFLLEPFSQHCQNDVICGLQQSFIQNYLKKLPKMVSSDDRRGLSTVISRFGNLLHLTISYFLFDRAGAFVFQTSKESSTQLYAEVISKISNEGKFGSKTWKEIILSLNKYTTEIDISNIETIPNGESLNCLFLVNGVIFPYYQKGLDMKRHRINYYFELNLILMMLIGELYLDSHNDQKLTYFADVFDQAFYIAKYYQLIDTVVYPPTPIQTTWMSGDWEKEIFCRRYWVPHFRPKKT